MDYLTVVAQIDETLQTVLQGVFSGIEHGVVDDQRVEVVAGLEAAHLAEEAACRLGGNPEGFGQGEEGLAMVLLVVHLADLDGIDQHAEHVEVMTTADVATQTNGQTFVEEEPDPTTG